jgi:hypothetical protein
MATSLGRVPGRCEAYHEAGCSNERGHNGRSARFISCLPRFGEGLVHAFFRIGSAHASPLRYEAG